MLTKDRRQMLAEALRIGHARCVVLFTIERHTETLSSGWFHGSDSPYGAVCSIHSIGLEVESSYCLYRFPPTTKSDGIRELWVRRTNMVGWNAGCAETCLSGVGSAGRKPTAGMQQGAALRLHSAQSP